MAMSKIEKSLKAVEPAANIAELSYKTGKSTSDEGKNWKSKLTAALDDTTLFISLAILSCFYFVYTLTNFCLGGNTRDQDSITSGCSCRDSARHLYRLWFSLSLIAWIFAYSYVPIQRTCQANRRFRECGNFLEAVRKVSFWKGLYSSCCGRREAPRTTTAEPEPTKSETKSDGLQSCNRKSSRRKELWYKYYKLYVMGYVEEIKPPSPTPTPSPTPAPADSKTKNSSCHNRPTEVHNCSSTDTDDKRWHILVSCLRGFILLTKHIAQLATVPLLMVQMFDTYALLCFAPNHKYCGDRSEYEIHLTQVVITMCFYIAIAVAQLTTTVLEWDPMVTFDQLQKKCENDA